MSVLTLSKMFKQRHDPVQFLLRRSLYPEPREKDRLLRERVALAQDLHWKDLKGHYGCVNAIEFSHGSGEFIASGGDDRRVLLWPVERMLSDIGKPAVMNGEHNSNIFCVAFDMDNQTLFSGGNDEQVVVHDIQTGGTKDVFPHEDAVYGLSADPCNPSVFASACDDGRLLIFDIRDTTAEPFCVANYTSSMHSVMYNPIEPRLLATANAKEGVGLWDVRKPKSCLLRYGGGYVQQSCMSVRFNQHGDQIIALRRRLPPVLYKLHSHQPVCEFDHTGYYNSCTMKSISFAGDRDQYVLSGSDDFNLYMWAIPDDLSERSYINSAHMVLKGHRSIVNQVRFNSDNHIIISSGVEKIIKVWSPFRLPSTTPSIGKDLFKERPVYSHEDYINLILRNGSMMTHDYTEASMEEDPRMIAFFDSLVQRELEGWSSDDTLTSNEEALYNRIMQLSSSDTDSTISSISSLDGILDNTEVSEANDSNANLDTSIHESGSVADSGLGTSRSASFASLSSSRVMHGGRANSPVSPANKGTKLSKMIRKKKEGLKDSFYRNRARLNLSSSSDSSSEEEQPVKSVIKKGAHGVSEKGKNPIAVQNLMKQRQQAMQASFVKLKRLNTLRNLVLNSDSDNEINIGTKELSGGEKADDETESRDVKNVHNKLKYTETASMGPYVHEMCQMFEAGSPPDPSCSSAFGYNSYASSSSKTEKSSIPVKDSETKNFDKSKHSSFDTNKDTYKVSSEYKHKWKPIGSGSLVAHNYSSFHNNVSLGSNQTDLVNNRHATSPMHKCDNSQHDDCDNRINYEDKVTTVDNVESVDAKEPVNVELLDKNSSKFEVKNEEHNEICKQVDTNETWNETCEHEFVNGHGSVEVTALDSIMESDPIERQDIESVKSTKNGSLWKQTENDGSDSQENEKCPVKHTTNNDTVIRNNQNSNSESLDKHSDQCEKNGINKEISSPNSQKELKEENTPSCSSWSGSLSLLRSYDNPDSPEIYRAAWTEFKKRKKSDNSKKQYRGHKQSDRHENGD